MAATALLPSHRSFCLEAINASAREGRSWSLPGSESDGDGRHPTLRKDLIRYVRSGHRIAHV
eukprot:3887991-Rhodomonas_salina.3